MTVGLRRKGQRKLVCTTKSTRGIDNTDRGRSLVRDPHPAIRRDSD